MPFNRTFLFAPGNHPRRVEKAFALGADAPRATIRDAWRKRSRSGRTW